MLVEEIDKRTYDPLIYRTSIHGEGRSNRRQDHRNKNGVGGARSQARRINYSLADMEARLYTQQLSEGDGAVLQSNGNGVVDTGMFENRFTEQEWLQSARRCLELDTENIGQWSESSVLLSGITGVPRDRIESMTASMAKSTSHPGLTGGPGGSSHARFEVPPSVGLSYKSTKPPPKKRKNTNRIISLKKVLSSRRSLSAYLDTLDQINRSVILRNVYNKKFFKVLPLITVCSICGGYESLSSCVNCQDKICSLKCYNVHNETRCTSR